MGELRILDKKLGDLKIEWDPSNKNEVAEAKKKFDELLTQGYMAWDIDNMGKKDNQIKFFDPELSKIIITPPLKKG